MGSARRCAGVLIIGLLALALAGAAAAETVSGEALVVGKDVALGTVTLQGQVVLHVDESTRIFSADGRRITLLALPVARRVGGGIEGSAEANVHYEARMVGGEMVADEIRAGVPVPE